jgi:hypothetical protein
MSPGPRCGPDAIANDLGIAGKNAAAELRLGEAVEGASAATLLATSPIPNRSNSTRRSSRFSPDSFAAGEESIQPPSASPMACREQRLFFFG